MLQTKPTVKATSEVSPLAGHHQYLKKGLMMMLLATILAGAWVLLMARPAR